MSSKNKKSNIKQKTQNKKNNYNKKIKNTDAQKISPAELYKILWDGRNTEISNLWQRSILLGTFLVLLWTASGWIFFRYLDFIQNISFRINLGYLRELFYGSFVLSTIGMIMSELWIFMTKGSKAWVEYSEGQINYAQGHNKKTIFSSSVSSDFPRHGKTDTCYIEKMKWNKCIFSTNGGQFSPSRINIMVGIISFIYFSFYWIRIFFLYVCRYKLGFIFPILNLIIAFHLLIWIKKRVTSGFLENPIPC